MTEPIQHPEEIRGRVEVQIGKVFSSSAEGRVTPAGIIAVGIVSAAILLATAVLVRAARR